METEMMGLLERHAPSSPKESQSSLQESHSTQQYIPVVQTPVSRDSYSTRKGKNKYFATQGATSDESNDELSKVLLGGVGLPADLSSDHSSKKQDVIHSDMLHPDIIHTFMKAPDVLVVGSKRDDVKKDADAKKDPDVKKEKNKEVSATKRDKGLKEGMKIFKDQLMDDGYDEEFAKITSSSKSKDLGSQSSQAAGSVRSILARAKALLQTLGNGNTKFEAVVEKRGHIPAQNVTTVDPETPGADVIDSTKSDLNLLSQSDLAHDLAVDHEATPVIKDIITQTTAAFSSKVPKEIVKKTTLPLPPNNIACGNTP